MSRIETFRADILPATLPISSAVKANGFVFISGQLGIVRGEPKLVPGGITAETRQAMDYIKEALELAGRSLDKVVKCLAFIANMNDFAAFNDVYGGYFKTHRPARSTVEVKALALGARIEIECVALV